MFLDWAFKPRPFNNDFLSFLTSKAAVTCMALVIAPPVLWLTFTWADRAAADSTDKMSTESVSSIYPDRPIRPLPKRRMRDRLSSEELDTINYPPAPQNNVLLFDYPYNLKAEAGEGRGEASNVVGRENTAELAQESSLRRSGLGGGGSSSNEHGYAIRTPPRQSHGRHTIPQPPPSTASSADGYDSFENTNNKKKRKIPTAGESMLNGSHVLSDPSIMGMPSPPTTGDEGSGYPTLATPHEYYQSGPGNANTQGISGPGRGRYGRNRNGRSPIRTIPDINVGLPKNPKLKSGGQFPGSLAAHSNSKFSAPGENSGIISNAIASAEKLPVPHGQENISLLQQQASSRATPTSSQFTFTFDSPVPGSVSWPGSESLHSHMAVPSQTSPPGDHRDPYPGRTARATQTGQPHLVTASCQRTPPADRVSELPSPPPPQDVWVCEFCEYERIFGRPPEALIRQYEIKDRRRRREEAERRRLLEKAKMKSRKGKKASNKPPAKNNNSPQDRVPAQPAGYQAPHMDNQPSQETQSEEFDEDDYYEEDAHDDGYIPASDSQDALSHDPVSSHDGSDPGGGSTRDTCVPVA
ncbi:hypothetical protein PG996_005544 [Apiospora saccharicola]|uniref:Uncharacterized protein n=1 Tax=Apiospora saccharicola TaxID=335842 RepID=A0ABR1VLS7_9PEZI